MQANKTFTVLAYFSILPLFLALLLAIYYAVDGAAYTGYSINFARLNAYIYAHSYGALLLALFAGIQIGQHLQSYWHVTFNFTVLGMAWFSFHSFADAGGMMFLLCCWIAAAIIDITTQQQNTMPKWYGKLKFKLNITIIILISLIIAINR